jgi:hypothetical protein
MGSASRFGMFIVVLAFLLQSYITQTHIHIGSQGFSGIIKIAATQAPTQGKTPLDNGRADCPFCQAIGMAGLFVTSVTPPLSLPFMWVKADVLVFTAWVASDAAAYGWQSRAPPRR